MRNSDTTLSLAPAAGSGIGKEVAADLLSRPGIVSKMADVIENALTATRRTWDQGSKCWNDEPDTRSQLQALFGILAHMEGEPIKRIIHQHLGGEGAVDPMAALQESPALRKAAQHLLDKASYRDRDRRKPKPTGPAELVIED